MGNVLMGLFKDRSGSYDDDLIGLFTLSALTLLACLALLCADADGVLNGRPARRLGACSGCATKLDG